MKIVSFGGYDCCVMKEKYRNGQIALQLIAADTPNNARKGVYCGAPIARATTCVPSAALRENETTIKNYSENDGIFDALLEAGIVKRSGRAAPSKGVIIVEVLI